MWNWFTFYLIVHILGFLIAFGPSFAFPILGAMVERNPQHAVFAVEFFEKVAKGMTIPLAVIVPLAGTGLIYTAHIDLWHSEWLVASIVLYTAAFFFAVFVQLQNEGRLLDILHSMPAGGPPPGPAAEGVPPVAGGAMGPPPEVAALTRKLRLGGMYLTFSVVVIAVLMIWRPGGAFTH